MTKPFRHLAVEIVPISTLKAYRRNAHTHPKRQIAQIAESMKTFGWTVPILAAKKGNVIAGHGRLDAAKLLGWKQVPVIRIDDMSEAHVRAYRLADNRLAENARWDEDFLRIELRDLIELQPEFEITATGFEMGEIDLIIGGAGEGADAADRVEDSDLAASPVSKRGDLWRLGSHRLLCGNALSREDHDRLMDGEKAELVIADPPYNLKIAGNVSGLGRRKHREFAMASGEMSEKDFTRFLSTAFTQMAASTRPGALHYLFMDWRHHVEMHAAGTGIFSELKAICIWDKGHGGMGSLYRSAYEMVFVFKSGAAPHINNVALGSYGRNRTNVWRYAGVNSFGAGRDEALDMHPTVKPVAMIADAILDASNRRGIVLDPFAGSGTILMAAERTGRHARAIELDPHYVDVALRRYRRNTGKEPVHGETGKTFAEVEAGAQMVPGVTGEAR